jgi:6-phosphofructokinase 1
MDVRAMSLGHLQRSRPPLAMDRLLATAFGIKAVELIEQGKLDRVVIWRGGQVRSLPLKPVIKIIKQCHQENRCAYPVDTHGFIVKTARSLGIYLGENTTTTTETAVVPQAVEVLV